MRPLDFVVTNTWCCVNSFCSIWLATRTSPCFLSSMGFSVFIVSSSSKFSLVGLSVRFTFPISVAMGWECHGTTFHLAGYMPHIRRSVKHVPSSMTTAKSGANPNQIWLFKLLRRRCSRMSLSNNNGCFVSFRSFGSLFQFIHFRHSSGIVEKQIRFTPAPLSRRHAAVCIKVVAGTYYVRSLCVSFAVNVK